MGEPPSKSVGRPALYALVVLGVYLSYLVIRPFLAALTWAAILAILFRRLQVVLALRIGPGRAALATTLFVGVAIVAPVLALVATLASEAPQVVQYLQETSISAPAMVQRIWDLARARVPGTLPPDPTELMKQGAQRAAMFLAPHAGGFVADFFASLGMLVVVLFALFFMLRDADLLRRQVRDRLPFSQAVSERLMTETSDLVVASVGASVAVAAAQGLIGGIAFWLVGIGAPMFWGLVMGFCSLLPVVGATIVWVPAAIVLLLSGAIGRGVALIVMGIFGISMADNVLRPLLLSGRTSLNGLVIFLGLLGGAAAFGFIGLLIGPIILVTTWRVLENVRHPERLDDSEIAEESPANASRR